MSLPLDSLSVALPVQSAVQVDTHLPAVLNHLCIFSQDRNSVYLLCLVPDEVIVPTTCHKAIDPFPELSVVSITDTPNNCRVIRVFLEMMGL